MSLVPAGTAESTAHIFQPSLPGLFSFWSNVYPGLTSWATFTPSLRDSEVASGTLMQVKNVLAMISSSQCQTSSFRPQTAV